MTKLPVHGVVLAGGKSSRMGQDKALLRFHEQPMIQIAVDKLQGFCSAVSIAGNRDDLRQYAPVITEFRSNAGPAAGVEAALQAASQPWILCIPVDTPLMPAELLQAWAMKVIARPGCMASYLLVHQKIQPAFCLIRRECLASVSALLESGERQLSKILNGIADKQTLWACDVAELSRAQYSTQQEIELWFSNINTPQELAEAMR